MRRIRSGLCRDRQMSIDLASQLQRYLGLDEREIAKVVSGFISQCPTLVDVGANDGYYTMAFLASNAHRVIACEPGPARAELLSNAAANGYHPSERFTLESRLVGGRPGEVSVAELLDGEPSPAFLKVDVDGGEVDVISSAANYRCLGKTRWVVETHSLELEEECLKWFNDHDFRTLIVDAAWWRSLIPEQRPLVHNRWLVAQPI